MTDSRAEPPLPPRHPTREVDVARPPSPARPAPTPDAGPALAEPVAVVGLGLIGGSLTLALRRRGVTVVGWADSADDRRLATDAGLRVADSLDALAHAGGRDGATIVLAVPPSAVAPLARRLLATIAPAATLLHVAGLQRAQALALDEALLARLIGTHPLAGSHLAGFAASRDDLFAGAAVSIEARAAAPTRARAEALWRFVGATRLIYRTAEEHDRLMAWVSHLPQLAATALAAALAAGGVDPGEAGPGLRDTTRLAESPLGIWADLLRAAPPETADALARLRDTAARLETAVARHDATALAAIWEQAAAWRRAAGRAR